MDIKEIYSDKYKVSNIIDIKVTEKENILKRFIIGSEELAIVRTDKYISKYLLIYYDRPDRKPIANSDNIDFLITYAITHFGVKKIEI